MSDLRFDAGVTLGKSYGDLPVIPEQWQLDLVAQDVIDRGILKMDAQEAPIWAEKLRHTYAKVFEIRYPELAAADGNVLPIDSSVDPATLTWEYFVLDEVGSAYWIGDDGEVAPSQALQMRRFEGYHHEMGDKWTVSIFELERMNHVGFSKIEVSNKASRKAHARWTNWVWLCGYPAKGLLGLFTHPNTTKILAPLSGGSRLLVNKDVDEILADFSTLINACATNTIGAYHTSTVFMPRSIYHLLRDTRLGAGDGAQSVLSLLQERYKGDDSGQGKVTFKILNECEGVLRRNPRTGTDTSGIVGDILLAVPGAPTDELCFIQSRVFTQLTPQERDYKLVHNNHSKIGGCKCQIPVAVTRMEFGLT